MDAVIKVVVLPRYIPHELLKFSIEKIEFKEVYSMTRLPNYFSIFGHKICPIAFPTNCHIKNKILC